MKTGADVVSRTRCRNSVRNIRRSPTQLGLVICAFTEADVSITGTSGHMRCFCMICSCGGTVAPLSKDGRISKIPQFFFPYHTHQMGTLPNRSIGCDFWRSPNPRLYSPSRLACFRTAVMLGECCHPILLESQPAAFGDHVDMVLQEGSFFFFSSCSSIRLSLDLSRGQRSTTSTLIISCVSPSVVP